jgi:hypothetical protein
MDPLLVAGASLFKIAHPAAFHECLRDFRLMCAGIRVAGDAKPAALTLT